MAAIPVALALYTVRSESANDFPGTLERVAGLGYKAVEFAGYGGLAAHDLRRLLVRTGLRPASSHVRLEALQENLAAEIDFCRTIGCETLVLPWLPPERRDPASMAALLPRLNDFGRACRAAGIAFAYHNHDFEFARDADTYLLDRLLAGTDPELVSLELDVYWAAFAGQDPVEYLRRQAGRVGLVHLKDLAADRSFAEVGDGTLDMVAICSAAGEAGARWLIVEHDRPTLPPLESAARSLANLRRILPDA